MQSDLLFSSKSLTEVGVSEHKNVLLIHVSSMGNHRRAEHDQRRNGGETESLHPCVRMVLQNRHFCEFRFTIARTWYFSSELSKISRGQSLSSELSRMEMLVGLGCNQSFSQDRFKISSSLPATSDWIASKPATSKRNTCALPSWTKDFLRRMEICPPEEFICPLTLEIFEDPVCTVDGHSYERRSIEEWFNIKNKDTSPKAICKLEKGGVIDRSLTPNHALRQAIETWKETMLQSQSCGRILSDFLS